MKMSDKNKMRKIKNTQTHTERKTKMSKKYYALTKTINPTIPCSEDNL